MAYKRLEQNTFKWPTIKEGVLRLDPAQFEALFAGLELAACDQLKPFHPLRQSESVYIWLDEKPCKDGPFVGIAYV